MFTDAGILLHIEKKIIIKNNDHWSKLVALGLGQTTADDTTSSFSCLTRQTQYTPQNFKSNFKKFWLRLKNEEYSYHRHFFIRKEIFYYIVKSDYVRS